PAKASGDFLFREIAIEVHQPTAVVVKRKWIFQHAVVNVAVGADGRAGAGLVGHGGVEARCRIGEAHPVYHLQGAAVERDQIAKPKIKSTSGDVNDTAVARASRSATRGYFGDEGIVPADALCRDPASRSVAGDAGQPATQPNWRAADHLETKVEIAVSIGGQWSIDFDCLLIDARICQIILEHIKIQMADCAIYIVWVRTH